MPITATRKKYWNTDQFPLDLYNYADGMMVMLESGGLGCGGLNFDARIRRKSTDIEDMFITQVGGMDAFARGLLIADSVLGDPGMHSQRQGRYGSFDSGDGERFENRKLDLAALRGIALHRRLPRHAIPDSTVHIAAVFHV